MLQRDYSDKLHIKIFHSMIDDNSDTRLTPNELYIYSLLCINSTSDVDRMMPTSINTINYMSPIRFNVKENNNKKNIKEALTELVKKGYLLIVDKNIELDQSRQPIGIKNNTFFTLEVNHDKLENKYERLFYNEFRFIKTPEDLFIYIVSKRFTGTSDGFKSSYNRWGKLLGVDRKTAIDKLKSAKERGIVEILIGKHSEKYKQDINIYVNVDLMKK